MKWNHLSTLKLQRLQWISNFIPQFIMDVITYPCQDLKINHVSKRAPALDKQVYILWKYWYIHLINSLQKKIAVSNGSDMLHNSAHQWRWFNWPLIWRNLTGTYSFLNPRWCVDDIFRMCIAISYLCLDTYDKTPKLRYSINTTGDMTNPVITPIKVAILEAILNY